MSNLLPIAIVLPHAGLTVPPQLNGRIALSAAQIFNEADAWTEALYDFRDRVLHWVVFPYARAIVDVNRPIDPALVPRPGDGVVKRRTSYGAPVFRPGQAPDAALENELIDAYWRPWHEQLAAIAADPQVDLVIDAHSMAAVGPSRYSDPASRRPRVMVGNLGGPDAEMMPGRDRLSAPPLLARKLVESLGQSLADVSSLTATGPLTAVNDPFFGGWGLWSHGGRQQPWLMIELSRALYVGDQSGDTPIPPRPDALLADLRDRLWQAIAQTYAWWQQHKPD